MNPGLTVIQLKDKCMAVSLFVKVQDRRGGEGRENNLGKNWRLGVDYKYHCTLGEGEGGIDVINGETRVSSARDSFISCRGNQITRLKWRTNKVVSQSCDVGKSNWRATGQSNLADRMDECSTSHSAVVWVWKPNVESFRCGQSFGCQVWLSSGLI